MMISFGLILAFAVGLVTLVIIDGRDDGADGETSSLIVRENSHRLSTAEGSDATFVEFLDFECEACGAFYPVVEDLRAEYGDRITFVVRYFPLPGHFNSERAARAAEAAAQQGQFEAMYSKLFETQQQWGEQRVPLDDTFRGFAQEIGLDMAAYDRDYAAPETAARVQQDLDDAQELGLQGTPSFFINGERFEPQSMDELRGALDEAAN